MSAPTPVSALRPAVFIDKDGTLVENVPYNVDPAKLKFMPGAFEALAALSWAGFALVVVSNQSGIGRNIFTRGEFVRLQQVLEQRLLDEAGVRLDDFLVCPHAPDGDERPACTCRKPAPGLLLAAAREHGIDLPSSWIVGDKLDDVEAGRRAGCFSALLDSGGETAWRRSPLRRPDIHCFGWTEVLAAVLGGTSSGADTGADRILLA